MNTSDPGLIRGFGIANIILSALALLAFAALGLLMGFFVGMMSDPAIANQVAREMMSDPEYMYGMSELYFYDSYAPDYEEVISVTMLVMSGLAVMIGIGAALSIISLVAGILAVRNYQKPEKLTALFGWSIAGAIAAFVCGRVVSAVLLILQTVCVHKQRQIASGAAPAAPSVAAGYPSSYGYAQPMQGAPTQYAPYDYAPAQPYGAPANNAAPTQAAAPAPGYAQTIPNAYPNMPAAAPAPMPHPAPAAQQVPNAIPAEKPVENPVASTTQMSAPEAEAAVTEDNETKQA